MRSGDGIWLNAQQIYNFGSLENREEPFTAVPGSEKFKTLLTVGDLEMNVIFQALQENEDEQLEVFSPATEEMEFLRCAEPHSAYEAKSKVTEPFSGSGWMLSAVPVVQRASSSHDEPPPFAVNEIPNMDPLIQSAPFIPVEHPMRDVRQAADTKDDPRRKPIQESDSASQKVNFAAAFAIGLVAVSVAVNLAQNRHASR